MKWVKRIAIGLIVLAVIILSAAALFLKSLDANRFKDQFAQKISSIIGRKVTIRSCLFDFSFGQGVTLQISGLSIQDDPQFSTNDFFYVDSAHLNIEIIPLITDRKILISKIELDSPKVQLIRNGSGFFNYDSLAKKEKTKDTVIKPVAAGKVQEAPSTKQNKNKDIDLGDMLIRTIQVSDGEIHFTDGTLDPAMNIALTQTELQISNVSTIKPFPVRLDAALWDDSKNVKLNGLVRIDAFNQQARLDDLTIKTDLSGIFVDRVVKSIPAVKDAGLHGKLGGELNLEIAHMVIGTNGLLTLSSEMRLIDASAQIKNVPIPVNNLNILMDVSEADVNIKKITLPVASGKVLATGQILDYMSEQKFLGNVELQSIQLRELTADMELPAKIEGKLNGDLKGNGTGLKRTALESKLTGEGKFQVEGGQIVDVNILKFVLSRISFLPNLVGQIEANLPGRYKEKLESNETTLEQVEVDVRLRNNAVVINQALVNADGFLLIANGNMDFDQNLTLDATLYISKDLSASMIASVNDLTLLLDDRQRIRVPFKQYRGKLARFQMMPDVEDIGLAAIRNKGREELKKALYKVIPREALPSTVPQEAGQGGETQEPQGQQKSPEEVIIENIIDMIPILK